MNYRDMSIKKFGQFISLLEARDWDSVKQYYIERKSSDGIYMTDELGKKIIDADPTENKMYVKWIIFKAFANMTIDNFIQSLRFEANELLRIFDRAKNLLPVDDRDLMKSCKDFQQLRELVQPYIEDPTLLLSKKQLMGNTPVEGQYNIIYSDSEWDIIIPFTHSASRFWGSGARWCTAYSGSSRWFDKYYRGGYLFIFRHKTEKDSRYQLHIGKSEFNNKNNERVSIKKFFDDKPNFFVSIFKFLKQMKKRTQYQNLIILLINNHLVSCVEALLKNGASPDSLDRYKKSCLTRSFSLRDYELVDMLLNNNANPLIELRSKNSEITVIELFLDSYINSENQEYLDKLLNASKNFTKSKKSISLSVVFDRLLSRGIYQSISNKYNIDIISKFLNLGIDFNNKNKSINNGRDMFHSIFYNLKNIEHDYGASFFNQDLFDELLNNIKDVNSTDNYGNTYLHAILDNYNYDFIFVDSIVEKLIEMGADKTIKNNAGFTPFDVIDYRFKDKWIKNIKPDDFEYDERAKYIDLIRVSLKEYHISENRITVNDDLTVDIEGDVYLNYSNFVDNKLPIKLGEINGNFYCNNSRLVSLENSPKLVKGNFDCSNNNLKTLEGGPEIVYGSYDCSNNRELESLKGSPKKVTSDFNCSSTAINTLEYGPKIVNGYYQAIRTNIKSNKGIPYDNYMENRFRLPTDIEDDFDKRNQNT